MLHIVNGDSVGDKLRNGIVQGEILVWREVYPHGPVFADLSRADNRSIRADYLEHTMGIPRLEYIQHSETQEKVLAECHTYDEVVLWFEHDLFDQTMLCYLLHQLSRLFLPKTKLNLLCIGEYPGMEKFHGLGQLTPEQLGRLHGTWEPISSKELVMGAALWEAYASSDPLLLQKLIHEDTSELPFAGRAFQAHLSRFPSAYNGLGNVEQATLERVQAGRNTAYTLFEDMANLPQPFGMGDLEYAYILRKMLQTPHPLLHIQGLKDFPLVNPASKPLPEGNLELTELGVRVLAGNEDWLAIKGMDEWYGGVHLQGYSPVWRWNSETEWLERRVIES